MDRFVVVSCIALVVVVFGLVGAIAFFPPATPAGGQYSANGAIAAARQFVVAEDTYRFDGMADTLKVSLNRTVSGDAFVVVAEFTSLHGGYGDRTDKMVTEALTPHRAVVTVDKNAVVTAVMDGTWDMIAQKLVASPSAAMPARDPSTATPIAPSDGASL